MTTAPDSSPARTPLPTPGKDHPLYQPLLLWLLLWIAMGAMALAQALAMDPEAPPMAFFAWYFAQVLLFAGLVAAFVLPDPDARRILCKPRPRALEFCILVGIVGGISLWFLGSLLPQYPWTLLERNAGLPFPLALVTVAVIPALFEEWMYRGLMLQRLRRVFPLGFALCIQAMMFSVLHMNDLDLLPLALFGLLAGVLRVAADSLWPSILLHFFWNATVTAYAYQIL